MADDDSTSDVTEESTDEEDSDELLEMAVTIIADDALASYASVYLSLAKSAIVAQLFPLDSSATWDDVPEKFHMRAVEICVYLLNKRGAEGEVSHSENGVSRTYGDASIPSRMFAGMVPQAGVPS